jgi:hypothetical protein
MPDTKLLRNLLNPRLITKEYDLAFWSQLMIAFFCITPMWPVNGFGIVKIVSMMVFSRILCDLMNEEHCDFIQIILLSRVGCGKFIPAVRDCQIRYLLSKRYIGAGGRVQL